MPSSSSPRSSTDEQQPLLSTERQPLLFGLPLTPTAAAKMGFFDLGSFRAHHISLTSMIIGFLAGYDSGVAGGILSFTSFQESFGFSDDDKSKVQSLTVSLQVLGCFLSCFAASYIVEKFGRKRSILAFSIVFIIGVIIQVSPTDNLGAWYFARVWAGLGQGALTVAVPIYTAEMAPPKIRGRLGSLYQWMFTLGIFIAYWINYGMGKDVNDHEAKQWQIPVGLQMVSGACLFFGIMYCPESTRWYLKQGRREEAWKSLSWVRASEGEDVQAEFAEMQAGLAAEAELKSGVRRAEILVGDNRKRVILGSLAFFFQQATGGSALAYFSPQFFQLLVGEGERDLLLTAIFGAVKLGACSLFIVFVAAWVGRKKPLMFGAIFMFACMLPIAIILRTIPFPDTDGGGPVPSAGIATVALVMLNVMAYNFSWGPIPWALVPEIFPNRTREMGVAICLTVHWLFNFVFTISTPYMIAGTGRHGWGTFLFYALFDLIMAAWVFFFVPETKNKSLERVNAEIDHDEDALNKNRVAVEQRQDHTEDIVESPK